MLSNMYILIFNKGKGYRNIFSKNIDLKSQSIFLNQNYTKVNELGEIFIQDTFSIIYKKIISGKDEYNRKVYLMVATLVKRNETDKLIIKNETENFLEDFKTKNIDLKEMRDYIEKNLSQKKIEFNFKNLNNNRLKEFETTSFKKNDKKNKHIIKYIVTFISMSLLVTLLYLAKNTKEVKKNIKVNNAEILNNEIIRIKKKPEHEIFKSEKSNIPIKQQTENKNTLTDMEVKGFLLNLKKKNIELPNFYYSFLIEIRKHLNNKISTEDLESFYNNNKPEESDLIEFKSFRIKNNVKIYNLIDSYLPKEWYFEVKKGEKSKNE